MKKCLSLVFAFIFAVGICFSAPVTINASAATTDELTFELNEDGKSYSVSKCNESAKGEISIPASYKDLPVTKIGNSAFYHCVSITNVNIPSSVVTIDESAFMYCDSLTSVTIPDSVKTIGDRAFHSCRNIKSVKLGSKVETIGINAFFASESLTTLVIPNSVKSLGQAAFAYCTNLTSVKIGSGVSKMDTGVFYFCSNLASVTISEGVTVIGETAFLGCEALKSVTVPSTVKTIGTQALGYSNSNAKTKGFVINGKSGSVAQKYATDNGFTFKVTSSVKKLSTPSVKIANTAKGIKVSWGAVANAESYIVYRSTYNASTKKWSKWSAIKKGVTATSYTDTKVKLGTSYKYTVRAVNGSVKSDYKGTSGLKYNVTPTVKVANDLNGIKVSWSTAANATGYRVYRSEYNTKTKKWSGWKSRGTAKANVTSWVDKKVTSGVQYKYTVRAVNGKILSSYNKNGAATLYLAVPTVKIANNANGIKVSWNKVAGSKGYTVYRSEYVNGSWTKWKNMGTAKNTKTSWVDKSAVSGVQYKYTARVINGNYKSVYKETDALIYLSQPIVNANLSGENVIVEWNMVSSAEQYYVYRQQVNELTGLWESWNKVATVDSTVLKFVDETVLSNTVYRYTVKAVNNKSTSSFGESLTVKVIGNSDIPMYSGSLVAVINNNIPQFKNVEITDKAFEQYAELDSLGRCGTAFACLGVETLPTEERGDIGTIKPTGWHTVKYDCVDGKYLYNRCHLIGFQLSAENANEKNLITGTRYLNVEGMLPFENMVADYIKETNNHVMYRVTPVFDGDNLLCNGVRMEAYSVEDEGEGISFNVFVYNIQPSINIDYATGESSMDGTVPDAGNDENTEEVTDGYILNTASKKIHLPGCSAANRISEENKAFSDMSKEELINAGYSTCGICKP